MEVNRSVALHHIQTLISWAKYVISKKRKHKTSEYFTNTITDTVGHFQEYWLAFKLLVELLLFYPLSPISVI